MADTFGNVPPPSSNTPRTETDTDTDTETVSHRRTRVTHNCLLRKRFFQDLPAHDVPQLRGQQVQSAVQLYFVTILASLGKRIGTMLELEGKNTITPQSVRDAARFLYKLNDIDVGQFNNFNNVNDPHNFIFLHRKVHWKHFTDALKRATSVYSVRLSESHVERTIDGTPVVSSAANMALACCLTMVHKFIDDLNTERQKSKALVILDRHLNVVVADPVHSHILGAAAVRVKPAKRVTSAHLSTARPPSRRGS